MSWNSSWFCAYEKRLGRADSFGPGRWWIGAGGRVIHARTHRDFVSPCSNLTIRRPAFLGPLTSERKLGPERLNGSPHSGERPARSLSWFAMSEVTRILSQIDAGDPNAAEQLLPLVYSELRKLAAAKLAKEKPGQTLQATALVHEAYLRLVKPGVGSQESGVGNQAAPEARSPTPGYNSRGHFFGAAAEAMRRILVEQARGKARLKRGGNFGRVDLDNVELAADAPSFNVIELDEALEKLAAKHPEKAELVKLRYFAGLTGDEAAAVLGISPATADRYWTYARAWLVRELSPDAGNEP